MEARCFSGARLHQVRLAAGLRPEQLAFHIYRSVFSIHSYECGRVRPPEAVVERLATVLQVTADDLCDSPENCGTCEEIESAELDAHVTAVVQNSSALTSAQRSRIATLLRHPRGQQHDVPT